MRTFTCFLLISVALLIIGANSEDIPNRQRTFAASIFQKVVNTKNGNVFFSPLSVEIILALIQNGAKGETALEIGNALRLPEDPSNLIRTILEKLESDKSYTLHTANKIYIANGVEIVENFRKLATTSYHAGLENVDFSANTAAANTINQWVESQTANKIKNLIKPSVLSGNTVAVLVNALYFKASWENAFIKHQTQKKIFHTSLDSSVQVDTMYQSWNTNPLKFSENYQLDAQFLEIPFDSEEAKMVIALPNKLNGITTLERKMNEVLAPQNYRDEYLILSLPKFKIETETTLNPILQQLKIHRIFNPSEADLSGIAGEKGDIAVQLVVQKGFIQLDEKGVEAAVATYATVDRILSATPKRHFNVNRPFIFYIQVQNVTLFIGKVVDPSV